MLYVSARGDGMTGDLALLHGNWNRPNGELTLKLGKGDVTRIPRGLKLVKGDLIVGKLALWILPRRYRIMRRANRAKATEAPTSNRLAPIDWRT